MNRKLNVRNMLKSRPSIHSEHYVMRTTFLKSFLIWWLIVRQPKSKETKIDTNILRYAVHHLFFLHCKANKSVNGVKRIDKKEYIILYMKRNEMNWNVVIKCWSAFRSKGKTRRHFVIEYLCNVSKYFANKHTDTDHQWANALGIIIWMHCKIMKLWLCRFSFQKCELLFIIILFFLFTVLSQWLSVCT